MPIYEYRCEACGELQEAIQKMSDAPLRLCKSCGKEALERVLSKTSFVLKGSGWYVTDYKSRPSEAKSESKAESAPASAPKADAST
ncbi:MAG TPA: zinc ribbon domain-containing protein [Myxococcota bacterium]|nr:zinc ribbon domain-containing protein [Myxococcota bacterium]